MWFWEQSHDFLQAKILHEALTLLGAWKVYHPERMATLLFFELLVFYFSFFPYSTDAMGEQSIIYKLAHLHRCMQTLVFQTLWENHIFLLKESIFGSGLL